jgi:NAD(P)-dependent dehydrogenase (short-subunit alcohol dehydrogenase family)
LRDKSFAKMDMPDFNLVLQVHIMGSANCTKAVWDLMREQAYGRILMTTSSTGLYGNFGQANYSAAKLGVAALSKSIALDMQRFGVRSNCIAPFAWSRMTSSIPAETPEQKARVARLQQMTPDKNAPLAVFLGSDAAKDVTGQIFAARHNELFLFSQPRPIRSVHKDGGWTPESVAEIALPAMRAGFQPLDRSGDVFAWDPV